MPPDEPPMVLPTPVRQIYIRELLAAARRTTLHEALGEALSSVDPDVLMAELQAYVPKAARLRLQGTGIRDELVFATPCVLRQRPSTLGYYRLLLGISQKQFYHRRTGISPFRSMEVSNRLPRPPLVNRLADLCVELNVALGELVTSADPKLTVEDIQQLPLLMLGAQLDGSWRTRIGQSATKQVFDAIKHAVDQADVEYTEIEGSVVLVNRSSRKITVALAADPDVVITEETGEGRAVMKVAIEIKGGTDQSNAHNRAGEAEKSHQKLRHQTQHYWTVMSVHGMDMEVLRRESPTTTQWFDVTDVIERRGDYAARHPCRRSRHAVATSIFDPAQAATYRGGQPISDKTLDLSSRVRVASGGRHRTQSEGHSRWRLPRTT